MSRTPHRLGCTPTDHPNIGRRRLLEAGGLSLFGLSLADLLRVQAQAEGATQSRATAKSVVFIFQSGGPSQHETWDPKPEAPAEIRGDYGTTATRTSGYRICEYLPKLASRSDRYSIVRTMHHTAGPQFRNEHNASMYMVQSGRCELPPGENTNTIGLPRPRRFEWPSIGSAIAYAMPGGASFGLPPVVQIPRANIQVPGTGPGMLGDKYARWRVDLAPVCRTPDGGGSSARPIAMPDCQSARPIRHRTWRPRSFTAWESIRTWNSSIPSIGHFACIKAGRSRGCFEFYSGSGSIPSRRELDTLRQRQFRRVVNRVGGPPHVGLPRVGARLAAAAGFFLAAEGPANLGAAGADVHVRDAAV